MANTFSDELSNAGGEVVKGMAKTAIIGVGVLTAGIIGIHLVARYVKKKKAATIGNKISSPQQVESKQEEDWL